MPPAKPAPAKQKGKGGDGDDQDDLQGQRAETRAAGRKRCVQGIQFVADRLKLAET